MIIMEKRGQVFLLAAIILSLAIFSLVLIYNNYEEKILLEDFPDLSKNYQVEAKKVVSESLISGDSASITEIKLNTFTEDYLNKYARKVDPNIGFIYIFRRTTEQVINGKNKVIMNVKNYLSNKDLPANVYPVYDLGGTINPNPNADTVFSDNSNALVDISMGSDEFIFKKTIPVRLNNFGDYSGYELPIGANELKLEIGGIFYNMDLNGNELQIIARSQTGTNQSISFPNLEGGSS